MIILAFDFETTGLDKENDHVIEIGAALYSTERKRVLESWTSLIQTEREIPQVVTEKTGIDNAMINAFGLDEEGQFDYFLDQMSQADAIVTQEVVHSDQGRAAQSRHKRRRNGEGVGRKIEGTASIEVRKPGGDNPGHGSQHTDPQHDGETADGPDAAIQQGDHQ